MLSYCLFCYILKLTSIFLMVITAVLNKCSLWKTPFVFIAADEQRFLEKLIRELLKTAVHLLKTVEKGITCAKFSINIINF